ncbi:MAG: nitrogenase-stabilizing/protective protein NifW [Actinomycetota bacterium]
MTATLSDFKKLVDAEDYFKFFELDYDPQVVNVNRLHILKKFAQYLEEIDSQPDLSESEKLSQYRDALQKAYEVFLTSNAVEQKLFKVFNDKPKNVVMLGDIKVE